MLCKCFGVLHFCGELSVPSIIIFLQFYSSGISVDKAAVTVFVEFEHMRKGMPKAISKRPLSALNAIALLYTLNVMIAYTCTHSAIFEKGVGSLPFWPSSYSSSDNFQAELIQINYISVMYITVTAHYIYIIICTSVL